MQCDCGHKIPGIFKLPFAFVSTTKKRISWLNASSVRLKRGQTLDSETEELPLYQIFRGMWLGLRGSTSAEVTKTEPAEEMSTP